MALRGTRCKCTIVNRQQQENFKKMQEIHMEIKQQTMDVLAAITNMNDQQKANNNEILIKMIVEKDKIIKDQAEQIVDLFRRLINQLK